MMRSMAFGDSTLFIFDSAKPFPLNAYVILPRYSMTTFSTLSLDIIFSYIRRHHLHTLQQLGE